MIYHYDIFLQASKSFILIDTSPNDIFFQGPSSLPDFYQSLHILPGDLLVTSSWLPVDNCLLSWLHFMISSFLHILHSQELTHFLVPRSYTTTSYSMRIYIMLNPSVSAPRDPPSQIILLDIEVYYLQPYEMTSQHPVLAYKYIHTSYLFNLSHPSPVQIGRAHV